ncbi:MAG TPA: hypothetical protein GXX37_07315 [Clostridiaceae bacterium]|nr:hypothetical protein [Clostridiaceae bacterium]
MKTDSDIKFSTLYMLNLNAKSRGISLQKNMLHAKKLRLNNLHRKVLKILNAIEKRKSSNFENIASDDEYDTYLALRWMLETGFQDDGLSRGYDETLDAVAALLIRKFKDRTVLPLIADLMFKRYNEGRFIYDLIWAYFEHDDPESLLYIGNKLQSSEFKDVELATRLLCFVPGIENIRDGPSKYSIFIRWYNDNKNYLYHTGETFHQLSNPQIFAISLEAKYLCIPVSHTDGKFKRQLTEYEEQCLNAFSNMDAHTKMLLANYSNFLFKQNYYEWNIWIHYPIYEQIRIATAARVGGI